MAAHVAEQIVAAAATLLLNGGTTAANHVFDSRVYSVQPGELPALMVDMGAEVVSVGSTFGAARTVTHEMELIVVARAKQLSTYRATLNQLRKEVEVLLANNNTLGNLAKFIMPRSFEPILSGDADQPEAALTMTFVVTYVTALNAPDVPL